MSEFSILKGVTVVILVTFGKIVLLFSVYNIWKNYLTFHDSWIDIYKICQSVFFSSLVCRLTVYTIFDFLKVFTIFRRKILLIKSYPILLILGYVYGDVYAVPKMVLHGYNCIPKVSIPHACRFYPLCMGPLTEPKHEPLIP